MTPNFVCPILIPRLFCFFFVVDYEIQDLVALKKFSTLKNAKYADKEISIKPLCNPITLTEYF